MQEWKEYLSIASFPNLQYLRTFYLPFCTEYALVEKTNGNIIEIKVTYDNGDIINTQRLIKAIAKNCPKLKFRKIFGHNIYSILGTEHYLKRYGRKL